MARTPYDTYEEEYWSVPREICVVTEISPIDELGTCEIWCGSDVKERNWVMSIATKQGYVVTERKESGYTVFTVKAK